MIAVATDGHNRVNPSEYFSQSKTLSQTHQQSQGSPTHTVSSCLSLSFCLTGLSGLKTAFTAPTKRF
jgi:hypothetical protein